MNVENYNSLLHIVSLLKGKVAQTDAFNMFSVLRSDSDEVRLHSRFIGALINPAYHPLGATMLELLLSELEVEGIDPGTANVQIEYSNIDILITDKHDTALIIENKINAGDQDKQLKRYYNSVKSMGYSNIYVRYLTLDGKVPSDESLDGLQNEIEEPYYLTASYFGHIRSWLENALSAAVRSVNVRESIFQYKTIVDRLTGADQGDEYMSELTELLLNGDNMKMARDIRSAYIEGLIRLQTVMWDDMRMEFESRFPEMYKNISDSSLVDHKTALTKVQNYYRKGKRYFGIFFHVPGYGQPLTVGVELEERLCLGVFCHREGNEADCEKAKKVLIDNNLRGNENGWWIDWRWHDNGGNANFHNPDEKLLDILLSPEERLRYIKPCVEEVGKIWNILSATSK